MEDLWKAYGEERDKLGILPDADADYVALDIAMKRTGTTMSDIIRAYPTEGGTK